MCLMCIEIAKGRMTSTEARRALRELLSVEIDPTKLDHYRKLDRSNDDDMVELAKEAAKS